jgi:hypothetical protein
MPISLEPDVDGLIGIRSMYSLLQSRGRLLALDPVDGTKQIESLGFSHFVTSIACRLQDQVDRISSAATLATWPLRRSSETLSPQTRWAKLRDERRASR